MWHLSGSQFIFTGKEIGWHRKNFTHMSISLSKRFLIFWHKCTCHNYYTFCFGAWCFSLLYSVTKLYSTTWLWIIVYNVIYLCNFIFENWDYFLFHIIADHIVMTILINSLVASILSIIINSYKRIFFFNKHVWFLQFFIPTCSSFPGAWTTLHYYQHCHITSPYLSLTRTGRYLDNSYINISFKRNR